MDTSSDDDGDEDHKRPGIIPKAGMCVSLAFDEGRCDGVVCEVEAVNGGGFALSVAFEDDKYVETNVSYPEKDDSELQFVYDSIDNIKTATVPDDWLKWVRQNFIDEWNRLTTQCDLAKACKDVGIASSRASIQVLRKRLMKWLDKKYPPPVVDDEGGEDGEEVDDGMYLTFGCFILYVRSSHPYTHLFCSMFFRIRGAILQRQN